MVVLASPASSSPPTPCGLPMTAPSGLPPAQVAAALREDLVRAAPQFADVLRYGSFTIDLRTDGVLLLVGLEHLRRQLTTTAAFRLVERTVARLLGGATPVAIRVMTHDDDSPGALVGSHCPGRLAG